MFGNVSCRSCDKHAFKGCVIDKCTLNQPSEFKNRTFLSVSPRLYFVVCAKDMLPRDYLIVKQRQKFIIQEVYIWYWVAWDVFRVKSIFSTNSAQQKSAFGLARAPRHLYVVSSLCFKYEDYKLNGSHVSRLVVE